VLRITTNRKPNSLSLRLEGQVEGPWVEVLRNSWAQAMSQDGHREIAVDLGGVSFANPAGKDLLLTMRKQGAKLIRPSGFMREVLYSESNLWRRESRQK
jgi:anti-anti-sigma regulatory factor